MLDDVRFQELVSEARTRIVRHSPDWTEHNVSDPGITLIELFAWLTDVLTYRINRIPRRVHLALLDLLGVQPAPPEQASTDLRFILDGPFGAMIPAGTEVASPRAAGGDLVTFQTDEGLAIPTAALVAFAVERGGELEPIKVPRWHRRAHRRTAADVRLDRRGRMTRSCSASTSRSSGWSCASSFDCTRGGCAGVDPADPPLAWEVSGADGEWFPAVVISDETGRVPAGRRRGHARAPGADGRSPAGRPAARLVALQDHRARHGRGYSPSPVLTAVTAAVFGGDRARSPRGDRPRRAGRHERRDPGDHLPASAPAAARARGGRDAGGARAAGRGLGRVAPRHRLRRQRSGRPALPSRPRRRRDSLRARDPAARRRLAQLRRGPSSRRRAALHPIPRTVAEARQHRPAHADDAALANQRRGGASANPRPATRGRRSASRLPARGSAPGSEVRSRSRAVTAEDFGT